MKNWMYYNHAMIPTTAPHEEADLTPILDGSIWKLPQKPLMARWTSDFDCSEETEWWYIIRKAPFAVEELSASSRKHIRQALKKCTVSRIVIHEHLEDLYRCYSEAQDGYREAEEKASYDAFCKSMLANEKVGTQCWAGFSAESGRMIGYVTCRLFESHVETRTAKFSPEYLKLRVSDALYYTVLNHYLNERKFNYISSGTRNINHITHTQEYKEQTFAYQKAYCRLHIVYNPKIRWAIKLLYLFRGVLRRFDGHTKIHQINAVLRMEEIARRSK